MALIEFRLILLGQESFKCLEEKGNTKKKPTRTHPYVIPAMVHFLKCMTLQVRVPVLSEKRYFTWNKKIVKEMFYYAFVNLMYTFMRRG